MKNRSILLTNDDGINSPGLAALLKAIGRLGRVTISAPATEQSGAGHAITVSNPIKFIPHAMPGAARSYAVTGTPADCVKIGVSVLMRSVPRLVVSGINLGPNTGISVIYSGTVSAAAEGAILGIPALAVSLDTFENPRWDTAARVARRVASEMLSRNLPPGTLLNVNVPNLPLGEIKGFLPTRMARSRFAEIFHRRTMPRGDVYYWMDGELEMLEEARGTDIDAVRRGYVSITPISFDLTDRAALAELKKWAVKL